MRGWGGTMTEGVGGWGWVWGAVLCGRFVGGACGVVGCGSAVVQRVVEVGRSGA